MKISMPIHLISEANNTEHWTVKHRRKKQIKIIMRSAFNRRKKPELPVKIIFTRVAPRSLDIDNLWHSMKTPIDTACDWLIPGLKPGHADSDKRIEIACKQRKGEVRQYSLEVEFKPLGTN